MDRHFPRSRPESPQKRARSIHRIPTSASFRRADSVAAIISTDSAPVGDSTTRQFVNKTSVKLAINVCHCYQKTPVHIYGYTASWPTADSYRYVAFFFPPWFLGLPFSRSLSFFFLLSSPVLFFVFWKLELYTICPFTGAGGLSPLAR